MFRQLQQKGFQGTTGLILVLVLIRIGSFITEKAGPNSIFPFKTWSFFHSSDRKALPCLQDVDLRSPLTCDLSCFSVSNGSGSSWRLSMQSQKSKGRQLSLIGCKLWIVLLLDHCISQENRKENPKPQISFYRKFPGYAMKFLTILNAQAMIYGFLVFSQLSLMSPQFVFYYDVWESCQLQTLREMWLDDRQAGRPKFSWKSS